MSITLAEVLDQADDVVRELQEAHARMSRTGLVDAPNRIEVELNGWGPGEGAIPRYRWIQASLRGETRGARTEKDTALPSDHMAFGDRVVIREGLLHLRKVPGLAQALEAGHEALRQPVDPRIIPVIARGLPPQSGIRIVAAWACVPASSLAAMLSSIRDYVLRMRT